MRGGFLTRNPVYGICYVSYPLLEAGPVGPELYPKRGVRKEAVSIRREEDRDRRKTMWVILSTEYLNLDHITRIRFSPSWKNGQEEVTAEVEVLDKGSLQVMTRYRGRDAVLLRAVLSGQDVPPEVTAPPPQVRPAAVSVGLSRETWHDG
jgi:hypothetical protein